jgi:hypothetical protein
MRAMLKSARPVHLLAMGLTLAAFAACKRHMAPVLAPRLELRSIADARADRVAEIVLPAAERTLASVGAIVKKLSLPFGDTDLRQMLLSRSQLPPGVLERADLSKPAALAVIVRKGQAGDKDQAGGNTDAVLAFALKNDSRAGFDAFAAAAGKVVETQKDAVRVQPGDGSGKGAWLLSRDGAVCLAETMPALVGGCALALEARRPVSDDVRVTVVPEGIARAAGTTLKDAMNKARQQMAVVQQQTQGSLGAGSPQLQAGAMKLVDAMMGWVFDAVSDTTEARLNLAIDATKGLSTTVEVVPRAGSSLARTIADRHPYALDPALLAGTAPAAVWSVGEMTYVRAALAVMRDPILALIPAEADRAKAGAFIDEMFGSLAGPMTARFSFEGAGRFPFAYDVVYGLKAGADGNKLLTDLESMMKAGWMGKLFDAAFAGAVKVKLATKREGETLVTQVAFDTKKTPAKMRAELKQLPFFDGTPLEGRTAVAGSKMIVTTGPGGKARLAALLSAPGAPPAGDLQAAVADTQGADGLYYADLAAMVKPVLALANSGAVANGSAGGVGPMAMAGALLANAHLATWASYRGGTTATVGWRIPMSTFESVGALVGGAMGGH